jgi:predicted ester cyclase
MPDLTPEMFTLVMNDIREGLKSFSDDVPGDFALVPPIRQGLLEEGVAVAAWEYTTTHHGLFLGLRPTGQEVTIRGVTLVENPDAGMDAVFHRYIDWVDVAVQLGLELTQRPVVPGEVGWPERPARE